MNITSLIFLPDRRLLASTSFQSLNRLSLSSGKSSRISLLRQSFSVSRPRLRPPGNIHSRPHLLLTNKRRPRFVATKLVSMTLPLRFRTASTTNRQRKFHSIPCPKKGNALSSGPVERGPFQVVRHQRSRSKRRRATVRRDEGRVLRGRQSGAYPKPLQAGTAKCHGARLPNLGSWPARVCYG
jgi:hypothetical protein